MISVEFKTLGAGTCGWCGKERDDIATIAFSDKSFMGPLCWKDLQRAIRMKVGEPAKPAAATANGPVVAAVVK